jgi:putative DNA primase/helicase
LYEEAFEFTPQFKIFLGTNHLPKITMDPAVWERVRKIPFAVQIPKAERDKRLDERLRAELPGILAWAVRGCLEWQ